MEITQKYFATQADVQDTARLIGTYNTSQWCPALPNDLIDFSRDVRNATYQIGVQLRDTSIQLETEMKGIEDDIEGVLTAVQEADATLEEFKRYVNAARVVVILIDIVGVSLILACILAWTEMQHHISICFRNSFIIPIFVVLIILFWIFSTASLLGAMAGSDFCTAPDQSTSALVLRYQENLSPLVFAFLLYYITVRVEKVSQITNDQGGTKLTKLLPHHRAAFLTGFRRSLRHYQMPFYTLATSCTIRFRLWPRPVRI